MKGDTYRAVVTQVNGAGRPSVRIGRLGGHEYGPLDVLEGPWTGGLETSVASAHAHGVGVDLARDDRVLVVFVEGLDEDPVVVGRFAT